MSTADTFASINFLHDRACSPYQVRPQPCTGPLLHKAGNRLPRCTRAAHNRVTSSQGWQAAFRCARASSEQLRDKRPCRKPKHRQGQSPPPQGQPRSLARGIVSCSVAPAPTGVAQFFERDGNCEALRPTADYDENALSFANVSPTRAGDFFRFAASRRASALRINSVRSEPQTSGAASSPPCALRANVPCSRGKAWRRHSPAACSSARSTGHPAYFEGNKRNARLRSRALCARLEKLCWPAFAPRVYRALKLRVRGSRSFCAPGRKEEYATSTALSLQASFRLEVLRRSQRGATSSMQSVAPVSVGLWHDGRHRLALEWPLLALAVRCSACCPCCRRGQNESTAHVFLCAEGSLDM
ncbi:hypothetical protein MRX96_058776 [Rhipicephalus microplus]